MKQQIKSTPLSLVKPKSIVFGLAWFNFILLWVEGVLMRVGACLVCPWFIPWSYTNEPSLLLAAASFLWISKRWSYVISGVLSGYVIGRLVYIFTFGDMTPLERLRGLLNYRGHILTEWTNQPVLAMIIFSFAVFYLGRDIYRKNRPHRTASNNSFNRTRN